MERHDLGPEAKKLNLHDTSIPSDLQKKDQSESVYPPSTLPSVGMTPFSVYLQPSCISLRRMPRILLSKSDQKMFRKFYYHSRALASWAHWLTHQDEQNIAEKKTELNTVFGNNLEYYLNKSPTRRDIRSSFSLFSEQLISSLPRCWMISDADTASSTPAICTNAGSGSSTMFCKQLRG